MAVKNRAIARSVAIVLGIALQTPHVCADAAAPQSQDGPSCGLLSVWQLCAAMGRPVVTAERQRMAATWPSAALSLRDVRDAAASVGIQLTGVRATIDELIQRDVACIIHTTAAEHSSVLLGGNDHTCRLTGYTGEGIDFIPTAALERLYQGRALLP